MATSIRCTLPSCTCECFAPGKSQLRTCEQCRHGWVAHALDKLTTGHSFPSLHAEVVHSDIAFDIASLMLYGAQATPVRLRILLDRLFSVLKSEEVDRILEGLGWGHEDYARGYILQGTDGKVLERWTMASRDEELVILNQFLRFGETKSIAEVMVQEIQARDSQSAQKKESDIRMFIERISDSLSEAQVKRIRKKGAKDGTPCRYARCECPNYEAPAGALRNSWLATCTACRHSESEHRLPTKHDKLKDANIEKAPSRACIGCDVDCQGYVMPDSSIPVDSPMSKQCANCKHTIDCHRPETNLDRLIRTTLAGRRGLQCHICMDRDDKQMTSLGLNECDDAEAGAWFEPISMDSDDDEDTQNLKICRCRGFRLDNLSQICQKYYGFPAEIVTPFLSTIPCQRCSHGLNQHRLPNEQEKTSLDEKKKSNLTLSGVVSLSTAENLTSQEAVHAFLLPNGNTTHSLPQLALARVETTPDGNYTILIALCPVSAMGGQSGGEGGRGEGKKRKKMGQILKDVKQKIKRRKTNDGVVGLSESDSTPDETADSMNVDIGSPNGLLRVLAQQVKVQTTIPCGSDAPTALAFCTVEVKRKRTDLLLAVGNTAGDVAMYTVSGEGCQKLDIEGSIQNPTTSVSKVALHSSHSSLYCGHTDGTVAVWTWNIHTKTMGLVETRKERVCRVSALGAAEGRKFLAVGYQSGDVLLYETPTPTLTSPRKTNVQQSVMALPHLKQITCCSIGYGAVTCLAWHPDKVIVAAGGEDDCITVFYLHTSSSNTRTQRTILQYFSPKKHLKPNMFYKCAVLKGHKSFISNVTFDPKGHFLLSTGWDAQVLCWSTAEIDDIIKIGDEATPMECFLGFILGQSQRTRKSAGLQGGGCPYVPLWIGVMGKGVYVLMRSTSSKVHLVGFELPKKIMHGGP